MPTMAFCFFLAALWPFHVQAAIVEPSKFDDLPHDGLTIVTATTRSACGVTD